MLSRCPSWLRGVVVALPLSLVLTACGSSSPSAKSTGSTGKSSSAKLVYFIFTGYTYPYFAPMAKGVAAAAKLYPDLNIKVVSANNSASAEITDINTALAAGAKALILNPVDSSVTHAAVTAMGKGVPVVTIDRDITKPSGRIAFIGDKDVTLGKEETNYGLQYLASHHVPKPWNVVILQGTLGASTATDRLNGALSALKPYTSNGSAKIVLNQSANFMTSTAQTLMSEFLAKTKNVQLVVAGNDAMALGAIAALKNRGLSPGKNVWVVGADAQPESLTAVKNGTQLDTVTHSPFAEAVWAVEAMDSYLKTKAKPSSPTGDVVIPMTVVTKANVAKISAWGTPPTVPALPYGNGKPVKSK